MNTAVRTLHENGSLKQPQTLTLSKPSFATLLLAVIVLLSALAVVYVADLNRRLFTEVQEQQAIANQLHLDWGKLLLEQSTWSTQARIQGLAQEKLGMVAPGTSNIIMVRI
jgi:cell division protein FtsL